VRPPKRAILRPAGNPRDDADHASISYKVLKARLADAFTKDQGWNRLRRNLLGLSSYLLQIVVSVLMHTQGKETVPDTVSPYPLSGSVTAIAKGRGVAS
jgi:hypothetical protein